MCVAPRRPSLQGSAGETRRAMLRLFGALPEAVKYEGRRRSTPHCLTVTLWMLGCMIDTCD